MHVYVAASFIIYVVAISKLTMYNTTRDINSLWFFIAINVSPHVFLVGTSSPQIWSTLFVCAMYIEKRRRYQCHTLNDTKIAIIPAVAPKTVPQLNLISSNAYV